MTDLASLTTLGVGGGAQRFFSIRRREEVIATFAVADLRGEPVTVLGGGSNVVVSDAGLDGTVVQISGGATGVRHIGDDVIEFTVDAGVNWDTFVAATVDAGAAGFELLSGIPGTVGAAPVQNIAAYGQQVCDGIAGIGVYDRHSGLIGEVPPSECGFGYRTSRFKDGDWTGRATITHVRFRLQRAASNPPPPPTYGDLQRWFEASGADSSDLATRRAATLAVRRAKSMVLDADDPMSRSAGSFFMNPTVPSAVADDLIETFAHDGLNVTYLEGQRQNNPDDLTRRIPAALLLVQAGFRPGDTWGPVQLSTKHVLAIVARNGASADDIWQLSWLIRKRVEAESGVTLHCEPQFLGEFADVDAAGFEARHDFTPGHDAQPDWIRSHR